MRVPALEQLAFRRGKRLVSKPARRMFWKRKGNDVEGPRPDFPVSSAWKHAPWADPSPDLSLQAPGQVLPVLHSVQGRGAGCGDRVRHGLCEYQLCPWGGCLRCPLGRQARWGGDITWKTVRHCRPQVWRRRARGGGGAQSGAC